MGAVGDVLAGLGAFLWPPVSIGDAPPGLRRELDVDVIARDGTRLEVNVHRPAEPGRFAVLLCPLTSGKDNLPLRKRFGYAVPWEYRRMRLREPISFSRMTAWRAPDPGWWVDQGYAVVTADLRGTGASDGEPIERNDDDVADLVAWCARAPWSNGSVGLLGVACPPVDVDVPTLISADVAEFYSDEAVAEQLRFFDQHLRGLRR